MNVNEVSPVVLEEKAFEKVDRQLTSDLWARLTKASSYQKAQ